MIEFLEEIDRSLVLFINGLHFPILDDLMWIISARITWIPLYVWMIYYGFKKLNKHVFFGYVVLAIVAVILSDQISVHLFKNVFERYRPSHNLLISQYLHFYEIKPGEFYKGGEFGFISSHAANFFAIATFVGLTFYKTNKKILFALFSCGILICFSRVYLGVHYVSDVSVGACLGMVIGFILSKLLPYFNPSNIKISK